MKASQLALAFAFLAPAVALAETPTPASSRTIGSTRPAPSTVIDANNAGQYSRYIPAAAMFAITHGFKLDVVPTARIDYPLVFKCPAAGSNRRSHRARTPNQFHLWPIPFGRPLGGRVSLPAHLSGTASRGRSHPWLRSYRLRRVRADVSKPREEDVEFSQRLTQRRRVYNVGIQQ
jgi:hypothetical protein